jgi:hypothetical protein
MSIKEMTISAAKLPPPTIVIQADFGPPLLTIRPNGVVEGKIENAGEAARLFVEHIRKYIAEPQADALKTMRDALDGWRAMYQLAPPHPDIAPDIWQNMIDRTDAALKESK